MLRHKVTLVPVKVVMGHGRTLDWSIVTSEESIKSYFELGRVGDINDRISSTVNVHKNPCPCYEIEVGF